MDKKNKNAMIVSIISLTLVLIGVTYAYFSARITGLESASTLSLTAGRMGIHYTEGDEEVTFRNIYPKEEAWATKTFNLTGYNTTDQKMFYNIGLNVITNTYHDDYLTYDLTLISGSNGHPVATLTNQPLNGIGKINFGQGYFVQANGAIHSYELKIYFKDNGLDQNDSQNAVFNAKIYVEEAFEPAPDGWRTAPSGSLLAGIKANYSQLSTMGSIPGVEPSGSGPITRNVSAFEVDNTWSVTYYNSLEDVLSETNGTYVVDYNTGYQALVGKWIKQNGINYVTNTTRTTITFLNNTRIPTLEENLLLPAEDDYGTSYYFRGAVDNNFVSFADMCWRIVRITGDGAIKLTLYNHNSTGASNPCDSSLDGNAKAFALYDSANGGTRIGQFNGIGFNNASNTHIGFMISSNPYSEDYATIHSNDVDSKILTKLKAWYDDVFSASEKNQLADVIWCNDKRPVSDTTYNPNNFSYLTGTGEGTSSTYYQAKQRLLAYDSIHSKYNTLNASPSLKCGNSKTDNLISKFTASTSTDGGYGNGALNGYKIGLLTTDELAFAGAAYGYYNTTYYLYNNAKNDGANGFWTLSPFHFQYSYPQSHTGYNGVMNAHGIITTKHVNDAYNGLRPAIALKSDVTISGGVGTQSNPFVVQ